MSVIDTRVIEDFLAQYSHMRFSVAKEVSGHFVATVYWPNGDVVRGKLCCGCASTLAKAVEEMEADIAKAEAAGLQLATAAECKAAVLDLIREHDAAPASFRDAVYALPVK